MITTKLRSRKLAGIAATAVAVMLIASCTDILVNPSRPTAPTPTPPPIAKPEPIDTAGSGVRLAAVPCVATVATRTVTCGVPQSTPPSGVAADIIIGGQNRYLTLASSNVDYDVAGQQMSFNVTIRNLIPQAIGTTDGSTPAPTGIRVFFQENPHATAGTGAITFANSDGEDTFLASGQAFFQYNHVLQQFQVSPAKTWVFNVPPTVESFAFLVYVSAPVQYPDGFIVVSGNQNVKSGLERTYTARILSAVGNEEPGTVTWSSAHQGVLATIDASTGVLHGYRAGQTTVTATAGVRSGTLGVTVAPIRRTWTGAVSSAYQDGRNWSVDDVEPQPTDTIVIPATDVASGLYPVLAQNENVAGIEVFKNSVSLGAFILTATGDVMSEVLTNAAITSTSGRLVLAGTTRTVRGNVPRLRVTGRYSLSGNLNISQTLQVVSGQLRDASFRIRIAP